MGNNFGPASRKNCCRRSRVVGTLSKCDQEKGVRTEFCLLPAAVKMEEQTNKPHRKAKEKKKYDGTCVCLDVPAGDFLICLHCVFAGVAGDNLGEFFARDNCAIANAILILFLYRP